MRAPHRTDGSFAPIPIAERFWNKVDYDGPIPSHRPDLGPCWLWKSCISPTQGYARIWIDGRLKEAHPIAYRLAIGPIPDGLQLDHLCRVRHCVRPSHLEAVTRKVNILRGESPMARESRQTSCIHGHAFDEANTWFDKFGKRHCRTCNRNNSREWHRAHSKR